MGLNRFFKKDKHRFIEPFLVALLGFIFFMGGFGSEVYFWIIVGTVFGIGILLLLVLFHGNIKFPPYFYSYSLFLALFILSLAWSVNLIETLRYFLLFLAGWAFWLFFYNIKKDFSDSVQQLILFLGVVYGVLFLVNTFYKIPLVRGLSLFLTPSAQGKHNHIGDFWAVVSVILVYKLSRNPKTFLTWFFVFFATLFLAASLSRAAYVSLAAGVVYLAAKQGFFKKYKKYKKPVLVFIIVFIFIFYLAATQKSILFSRPYFIQSLVGLKYYPLGVGVGNFGTISSDSRIHVFGLSDFSFYTHNIILEMISGMGILGVVFAVWLTGVSWDILTDHSKDKLIFKAIFLALTVNFFFDYTYFISTMTWLWFVSLGLVQRRDLKKV